MIDVNPFPPPPDAALDAPAPTEADHEVPPPSLLCPRRLEHVVLTHSDERPTSA